MKKHHGEWCFFIVSTLVIFWVSDTNVSPVLALLPVWNNAPKVGLSSEDMFDHNPQPHIIAHYCREYNKFGCFNCQIGYSDPTNYAVWG